METKEILIALFKQEVEKSKLKSFSNSYELNFSKDDVDHSINLFFEDPINSITLKFDYEGKSILERYSLTAEEIVELKAICLSKSTKEDITPIESNSSEKDHLLYLQSLLSA